MMWYGAVLAFATMWGVLKDAGLLDRPFFVRPGMYVRFMSIPVHILCLSLQNYYACVEHGCIQTTHTYCLMANTFKRHQDEFLTTQCGVGYKVRLRDDKVALVKFAMRKFTILPAISVFLAVAAIVVSCFFAYNAWNISWGLTGNDRHKLSELNRKIVLEVCFLITNVSTFS